MTDLLFGVNVSTSAAAGADPVDDRRGRDADQFTGPPAKIVDSVRRFAGLGFTAFNFIPVGHDPAGQVQRLAAEVLPALRA